jgi:hypothetical protein
VWPITIKGWLPVGEVQQNVSRPVLARAIEANFTDIIYVLIHSPLVGPLTWQPVQAEMVRRGMQAITPALLDNSGTGLPYWRQHADSLANSLKQVSPDRKLVLIAHSGAGPLLPVMRQPIAHSIAAYVFVDAGIPRADSSRLDLMRQQDPEWAEQFHQELLQGGRFPTWTEQDLLEEIPDDDLRRKMAMEVNPRSLSFFIEPLPVFSTWPDAPCAYIKFSASYDWDFNQAKRAGWYLRELNAGHFHMLVDPALVADMIIDAVQNISQSRAR